MVEGKWRWLGREYWSKVKEELGIKEIFYLILLE